MSEQPMPPAGSPVSLREITADTVRAVTTLAVAPAQQQLVAPNAVSLAQALFAPTAWYRAVYAGEQPVGFVMLHDETLLTGADRPAAPTLGLWRFMIDARAQRRGFGRAALALVIAHALSRPGIQRLLTSCVPGPGSPQAFYEGLGFVATGEVDDGEVVLALTLPPAAGPVPAPAPTAACPSVPPTALTAAAPTPAPTTPTASSAAPAEPGSAASALAERLIRNIDRVTTHRELREPLYDTVCTRLAPGTAARQLGASIDTLAPGQRGCPYHLHHAQEELFFIVSGHGSLRVAGEMLPLVTGDVVFIPPGPDYPHQIINTSDAPLRFLSVSTRQTPEIVEYPDSGKFLATAQGADGRRDFDQIQRLGESLDYWEGEP
jgi:uncharacterized cupin superfamily protein/GNAT superfamily N-acetyltransferase